MSKILSPLVFGILIGLCMGYPYAEPNHLRGYYQSGFNHPQGVIVHEHPGGHLPHYHHHGHTHFLRPRPQVHGHIH